eukprot:5142679-Prymnesium_polylepis.1
MVLRAAAAAAATDACVILRAAAAVPMKWPMKEREMQTTTMALFRYGQTRSIQHPAPPARSSSAS